MGVGLAISSVFLGCCSNVVFLEYLVKNDPGNGNLVTFAQFLFIALQGFIFTSKCGTVQPKIKLWDYMVLVGMFFFTSVCNNYAFDFNIAMPLHMIFRAGSLIANLVMGIIILKKTYTLEKYLSVSLITLGIILCTVMSSQDVKKPVGETSGPVKSELEDFFWWTVGITLLTVALFVSARMGIYQEVLYKRHGKHPFEALYYTHLIPLPAFALLYKNLWEHWSIALESPPMTLPALQLSVPSTLVWLAGNVVSQYLCISSVYYLTTECSSLTVTLVVTLRKFTSLIFSIVYFKNPFTIYHWIGTILVFIGTLIFTEVPNKIKESLAPVSASKKKE